MVLPSSVTTDVPDNVCMHHNDWFDMGDVRKTGRNEILRESHATAVIGDMTEQ